MRKKKSRKKVAFSATSTGGFIPEMSDGCQVRWVRSHASSVNFHDSSSSTFRTIIWGAYFPGKDK